MRRVGQRFRCVLGLKDRLFGSGVVGSGDCWRGFLRCLYWLAFFRGLRWRAVKEKRIGEVKNS